MSKILKNLLFCSSLIFSMTSYGLSFELPSNGDNVVGALQTSTLNPGQDLHDIGQKFDIGYDALLAANPGLDPSAIKKAVTIVVPSMFVLPPGPHVGIVINIAEKRLYYYPAGQNVVYTYPIGVGLLGWSTPTGSTYVIEKIKNPVWTVPSSIYQKLANQGIYVPEKILPGPDDPLGDFALRLNIPGYLIHGTNEPSSIGTRASSGCIRLFPDDIQALFAMVPKNTPVQLMDAPYKAGWLNGQLYAEAHAPLADAVPTSQANLVQPQVLAPSVPIAEAQALANDTNNPNNQNDQNNQNNNNQDTDTVVAQAPTSVYQSLDEVINSNLRNQKMNVNNDLVNQVATQQTGVPQVVGGGNTGNVTQ